MRVGKEKKRKEKKEEENEEEMSSFAAKRRVMRERKIISCILWAKKNKIYRGNQQQQKLAEKLARVHHHLCSVMCILNLMSLIFKDELLLPSAQQKCLVIYGSGKH